MSRRNQLAVWCIGIWIVALGISLLPRMLFGIFIATEPLKEYPSPDGKWILATYYLHQRFPPETDFWVQLRPSGARLRHWGGEIVAVTEYAYAADVIWESPTKATVRFVEGFGYADSPHYPLTEHQQIGDVQVTIDIAEQLQTLEKPLYSFSDTEKGIVIFAKIYQYENEPPIGWRTELRLGQVTKQGLSTVAKYERVLLVNGQYDIIRGVVSTNGIILTLPTAARDAVLERKNQLLDLPIQIAFAE